MLAALAFLAVLGIRYPVKMLPLLFFELLWKVLWVVDWGLPLWYTQPLAPDAQETLISCLVGVVLVPLVMPWGLRLQTVCAGARRAVREAGDREHATARRAGYRPNVSVGPRSSCVCHAVHAAPL